MSWIQRGSGSGWWSLYRAMSDEELLGLAARPGDLTDEAQGVLRNEMGSRRLQVEAAACGGSSAHGNGGASCCWRGLLCRIGVSCGCAARAGDEAGACGEGIGEGDGGADDLHRCDCGGRGFDFLEAEGMEIEVRDVAKE